MQSQSTPDPSPMSRRAPLAAHLPALQLGWITLLIALAPLAELLPPETLLRPACWLIVLHTAWMFWSWRALTGRLFDAYGIFLFAATLFNGSYALLLACGADLYLTPSEIGYIHNAMQALIFQRFGAELALKTYYLILASFAALHFGALLAAAQSLRAPVRTPADRGENGTGFTLRAYFENQSLLAAGALLLLISGAPALLTMRNEFQISYSEGYFGLYTGEQPTGAAALIERLALFFLPALLLLLASADRPQQPAALCALALALLYAAAYFYIGSRVTAINALLAFTLLWHWRVARIPKTGFLAGTAAILILIPPIALTRMFAGGARLDAGLWREALFGERNPFIAALLEMGSSAQITYYALQRTPAEWDFQWGAGFYYSFLSLVPNFFWELHPAAAYEGLSTRVKWLLIPEVAAAGGGLGTNFIAEFYYNFSWLGLAVLAAFGYAVVLTQEQLLARRSPTALALLACLLPSLVFMVRNSFTLFCRGVIWYALAPVLLALLLRQLRVTLIPVARQSFKLGDPAQSRTLAGRRGTAGSEPHLEI